MSQAIDRPWVKVWDPLVRVDPWGLAVAFVVAYLSAEEESGGPSQVHVWSGYAVGIIVAVRIVWGLIGSKHARFSDFAFSPIASARYVGDLVHGHARRYLGHNPIGAAMVFALLVCLSGAVVTGIMATGDAGKGSLANVTGLVMTPAFAEADEGAGGEKAKGAVGGLHSALANITLGLVVLHILGVGFACSMHRENLVFAMVTGRKRRGDES